MSDSDAVGCSAAYSPMRRCQRGRSLRRAASAMTGLQVAPTAPQPIAADSSDRVAESFHSTVGVSCAMRSSGGAAVVARSVISLLARTSRRRGARDAHRADSGAFSRSAVAPRRRVARRLGGFVAARVRRVGVEQTAEGLVDLVDGLHDLEAERTAVLDDL